MIVKRGKYYIVYDEKGYVVLITTNRRIAEWIQGDG